MKIKQEETGKRKGGKGHILSFSHHRSLFPDHALILSSVFYL